MSAGPANALRDADVGAPQIARSAVVVGTARLGEGSLLAEGAVIRSDDAAVRDRHRVGRARELGRRRHPHDPDDDRAAHHLRPSLHGDRGDRRRPVRDRQRLRS